MSKFELNTQQPLQIYTTVAQAFRSKKISVEETNKSTIVRNRHPDPEVTMQIKEVLKMNHKIKAPHQWQSKSHLPMGMIVSKMATRTPVIDKSEDPLPSLQDIDLSMLRKQKLTLPSWKNKPYQRQSSRPTELEKLIASMKEKCSQFDIHMLKKPNALSQGKSHTEMAKTVANARNADGGSSASDLDYNYHQLYGKCQKMKEDASKTTFLDEDPVGDCVTMNCKDSQTNASTNRSSEETFVFNPTCKMPQPEFKWNPIIVENSPKRNSPLSWLTSQTSSELDSYEQYHNAHHNQRFLRRNLPPEYEFRKQFLGNCHTYEPDQDPPPSYYETEFHSSHRNLPFFKHSSSPESWEISSNSSGQTIAEERLQLTYYTSCPPRRFQTSTDYPISTRNSRSDRPKPTFSNFLEE